ncbi:hypothetical protein OG951_34115 [Streptomyces anulatus]
MTARSRPRGFAMRHLSVYPGLTAYAVPRPDGNYSTDRNGNPKVTRVTLEPEGFPAPHRPPSLTDSQWAFATNGRRRWQSAVTTFGDHAEDITTELARNGCIVLECDFRDARVVLPPRGWAPHPDLQTARQEHNHQRAARRAAQDDEARRLIIELTPYPAAKPLLAFLGEQRDSAFRDHVIKVARVFLTDETMTSTGGVAPWAAVQWLKRGARSDYERDQEPLAEGGQGAVYGGVHKYTRIPVALKQLRYGDEDSVHRMGREISIGHLYGESIQTSCRCSTLLQTGGGSSCRSRAVAPPATQNVCGGRPELCGTSSLRSAKDCAARTPTTGFTATSSQQTSCFSTATGS